MADTTIIGADGQHYSIPAENLQAALTIPGTKQAVATTGPDGNGYWLPMDRVKEAVESNGFKVGQPSAQAFADRAQNAEGGLKALGSDLLEMGKGITKLGNPYYQAKGIADLATNAIPDWKARKEAGRSTAYNAGALANEALGVNVKGEEQAADVGDQSGVVGHASAVPVAMGITAGVAKALPGGVELAGKGARAIAEKSIEQTLRPMPKMFRFGKDPVGFVLDNKITANSLPELKANIDTALQAKNSELNGVLATAPKVDLRPAAIDLQNAIRKANTQRNIPVARQLSKLYNDMFVNKPMNVSAVDAAEIKRGVQDSINWESDGPGLSSAKKQLQHSVGEQIYKSAPDARPLSEDISSGIEASKAAEKQVLRESAGIGGPVVRPGMVGGTVGAGVGLLTGNPAIGAGAGALLKIGGETALRKPMLSTRVAAGMNKFSGFADPFGQTQIPSAVGLAPLGTRKPKDTPYPR